MKTSFLKLINVKRERVLLTALKPYKSTLLIGEKAQWVIARAVWAFGSEFGYQQSCKQTGMVAYSCNPSHCVEQG